MPNVIFNSHTSFLVRMSKKAKANESVIAGLGGGGGGGGTESHLGIAGIMPLIGNTITLNIGDTYGDVTYTLNKIYCLSGITLGTLNTYFITLEVDGNYIRNLYSLKTTNDHFTFFKDISYNGYYNTIFKATGPMVITFTINTGSDPIENDTITPRYNLVEFS